jgi:nucleotide-binding universal stress UspA family protein
MRTPDTEAAIVVGIASEGRISDGTVDFVIDTAQRLDVGVQLVHAVPTLVGGPTGTWEVGISFEQLLTQGRAVVDQALARFRERARGKVPVEAEVVRGGVVATLIHRSRTAQLVVLEHRHLSRWTRFNEGSVTSGVAARAHAPVVAVPAGWHPARRPLPITVAVEDAQRAQSEIWTALGLAAALDLPVRLLRVAYLPQAFQELLRRDVDEDDLLLVAREELERDARLPETVCAQVPCTFEVRWGEPAEVLVDASASSSLVVVARRDPAMPIGSHLGSTVRRLLRQAEGPVMVVEPNLAQPVVSDETTAAAAG